MEDRSDGRKAGYGLGESLPENGICVIHLSRTFKELLMKIVKTTLAALVAIAVSTSMAQAADPAIGTLSVVDETKWDVANKGQPIEKDQEVWHGQTRTVAVKDIYQVKEIVAAPKTEFIAVVRVATTRTVDAFSETPVFVVRQSAMKPWAFKQK